MVIFSELNNVNLSIYCEYKKDVISETFLPNILNHFVNLLESIQVNKDSKIKYIDILSTKEINELIQVFDSKIFKFPKENTIVNMFESQVENTPDSIAIKFKEIVLTYKSLNEKVNQLAQYFQGRM